MLQTFKTKLDNSKKEWKALFKFKDFVVGAVGITVVIFLAYVAQTVDIEEVWNYWISLL